MYFESRKIKARRKPTIAAAEESPIFTAACKIGPTAMRVSIVMQNTWNFPTYNLRAILTLIVARCIITVIMLRTILAFIIYANCIWNPSRRECVFPIRSKKRKKKSFFLFIFFIFWKCKITDSKINSTKISIINSREPLLLYAIVSNCV